MSSSAPPPAHRAPPAPVPLLAVPNVSEGRDRNTIEAISDAFCSAGARLLDVHSDPDHHRSVFTLTGAPGQLSSALLRGFEEAVARVGIADGRGQHPHVGAIDVAPIVYPGPSGRGAAVAEALLLADLVGSRLEVPVLLYGSLAGGRTRAEIRAGGAPALAQRIEERQLSPDFGPRSLHPTAGATLIAARPPLVALNLELAPPAGPARAREIAALIREGGAEGLPGLRAIGITLRRGGVRGAARRGADAGEVRQGADAREAGQVSMNVEEPSRLPLREVVEAVRRHADIAAGELVGLAPSAAFDGFPADLPMPGLDRSRHLIENALGL